MFLTATLVFHAEDKIVVNKKISAQQGKHRLLLKFIEVPTGEKDSQAFDFHSLVWEENHDNAWKVVLSIQSKDFKNNHDRWVSDLDSLDAEKGVAILKIAEMSEADADNTRHALYSWCEWDLRNNKKLRTIKKCKDPFEPLEEKKRSAFTGTKVMQLLEEAQSLAKEGKYEESLQKHLKYHEESKSDFTQGGVRLSFALGYWASLGKKYRPALDKLTSLRDEKKQLFEKGKASREDISELLAMNRALEDSALNIEVFKNLDKNAPAQASYYFLILEKDLLEHREYPLYSKYLKNPLNKLSQLNWMRSIQSKPVGEFAPDNFADNLFTEQVCQLLKVLSLAGRKAEAEKVRDKAQTMLNTPEMRSAMEKALQGNAK